MPLPGPGRRRAGVRQRHRLQGGGGDNGERFGSPRTASYGLDTLFGDGTGGAGSDLAVMPAVDAKQYNLSHFDNSDIWFEASNDQNIKTGWLGRWIDRNGNAPTRCRRSRSTPRCRSRSARTASPCARSRRCRWRASRTRNSQQLSAAPTTSTSTRRCATSPAAGRRRQRVPRALARDVRARRTRPGSAARSRPRARRRPRPRAALPEQRHASAPACGPRRTLLAANLGTRVITIHWGGFDTHTGQLAVAGPPADRVLARARRVPGRPAARGIEQRVATLVVLGVRPPRAGERHRAPRPAPTTARAG